jgi:hypothetical protein
MRLAPGRAVSRTIASFSSSLKKRRSGIAGAGAEEERAGFPPL